VKIGGRNAKAAAAAISKGEQSGLKRKQQKTGRKGI